MAYSTIRPKKGNCKHPGCGYYGPLIGGKCEGHYWQANKLKSAAKADAKEIEQDESLSTVIDDLDAVFSQYIRLRDSDENGYIKCYCDCGRTIYWTEGDCMHYMDRDHMNTRFSEDNCHGGCKTCNQYRKGNLQAYGDHLERVRPGIIEALAEQARAPYKYDVPELKSLISYYSKEVKRLKKLKPMKL